MDTLLDNPIFFLCLSYTFGLVVDQVLRKTIDYSRISGFQLFRNARTYEQIGILHFRRLLVRSRLTMNPGLKDGIKDWDVESLKTVRDHMAGAEIGHWAGAVFLLGVTFAAAWFRRNPTLVVGYLVLNLLGNVYLSLLQQYNKRHLDRILKLAAEARASREQHNIRQGTQHGSIPASRD